MTKHAEQRCRQRGVRLEEIILILRFGTFERGAGNSFWCMVSRTRLMRIPQRRLTRQERQMLDKIVGVILVLDGKKSTIITVQHRVAKKRRTNPVGEVVGTIPAPLGNEGTGEELCR